MRQVVAYGAIGGLQFLLDNLMYMSILAVLGWPLVGNVGSRATAAVIGFWLNSRFTFSAGVPQSWRVRAYKYAGVWLLMTLLSSGLIAGIGWTLGASQRLEMYVVIKFGVEVLLFIMTFVLMKGWVFKQNHEKSGRKGV